MNIKDFFKINSPYARSKITNRDITLIIVALIVFLFIMVFPFFIINEQVKDYEQDKEELQKTISEYFSTIEEIENTYTIPLSQELIDFTIDKSNQYGVDENLIFAIMKTESEFKTNAKNGYCVGLMQISKSNIKALKSVADGNTPEGNIELGIYLFKEYYDYYKDYNKALIRYNNKRETAKKLFLNGITNTKYTEKVYENLTKIKE